MVCHAAFLCAFKCGRVGWLAGLVPCFAVWSSGVSGLKNKLKNDLKNDLNGLPSSHVASHPCRANRKTAATARARRLVAGRLFAHVSHISYISHTCTKACADAAWFMNRKRAGRVACSLFQGAFASSFVSVAYPASCMPSMCCACVSGKVSAWRKARCMARLRTSA